MINKLGKNERRQKRHMRIRNHVSGTAEVPRLNVFRSSKNIYTQIINDVEGTTLASASSVDLDSEGKTKAEQAAEVGRLIAEAAKEKNIEKVVFDRGGYQYHGRVKAVAEAARENGLKF